MRGFLYAPTRADADTTSCGGREFAQQCLNFLPLPHTGRDRSGRHSSAAIVRIDFHVIAEKSQEAYTLANRRTATEINTHGNLGILHDARAIFLAVARGAPAVLGNEDLLTVAAEPDRTPSTFRAAMPA